jgi:hypothetical protein
MSLHTLLGTCVHTSLQSCSHCTSLSTLVGATAAAALPPLPSDSRGTTMAPPLPVLVPCAAAAGVAQARAQLACGGAVQGFM